MFAQALSLIALAFVCSVATSAHGAEIIGWGDNISGQISIPLGLTNVGTVAASTNSAAVTGDGRVTLWGFDENGHAAEGAARASNVVALALGGRSLALSDDGRVSAWAFRQDYDLDLSGVSNVVAIAAGLAHVVGLFADGAVVTWGSLEDPNTIQTNFPSGVSNIVAIAAGIHTLALTAEGHVHAWGPNWSGENDVTGDLTNVVAIAAGWVSSFALQANGRVVGWGAFYGAPEGVAPPPNLTNAATLVVGGNHALALTTKGELIAWGRNISGESSVPIGLSNVVAVAAGHTHSLALIDPAGTPRWHLPNPLRTPSGIVIDVPTQRGRLYILEHKPSLDREWSVVQRFAGDGSIHRVVLPAQSQAFYRGRRFP